MKTFIPHVYFSAPEDTVGDLVNRIRRESEIPGTAEPKPEMKDSGKKSIIPKTVVSAAKSELDRVYDLLTSGEDLQMNPDGTLSPASAPKKRAKPAPGSEPKAPVKTKKEIIPHTVVSAPEKDTVGDLIEQLHKEPEPLPEEQPEEKAETPEKTDGKKSVIPKTIVSAPVQQWYKTNKALYNAEVAAMRKEFNDPNMQPHFMSDGRMYWLVKTRPNLGRGFKHHDIHNEARLRPRPPEGALFFLREAVSCFADARRIAENRQHAAAHSAGCGRQKTHPAHADGQPRRALYLLQRRGGRTCGGHLHHKRRDLLPLCLPLADGV